MTAARKTRPNEPLMTTAEAAAYLNVPAATVKAWRGRGTGPTYIRIHGQIVRYRVQDLDEWVDEQQVSA